ncbi:MAG TPA: hypothetical protein VNQ79_28335 [Blastocatellia bacterium]|nr:hypothetical protein [Blastocatellia bacterium]
MSSMSARTSQQAAASSAKVAAGPRRARKILLSIIAVIVVFAAWAAFDLFGPRATSLRQFDANEVARLETAMWRSYYDKQRLLLFRELAELMRTQYRLPYFRSNAVAFQAAKAAFVFKEGHGRSDYEKALPNLVKFYRAIHQVGDVNFNVERAAKLELEWWIIHRERKKYGREALERALAELPAEIYQIPADRLMEHARLRAEAMLIRDDKAEAGGVSEADWQRIDELLHASWQSLYKTVNQ